MLFFTITYAFYQEIELYLPNTLTVFFQSCVSFLFVVPFVLFQGKKFLYSEKFPMILLRTILGLIGLFLITEALLTTNLADIIVLNNTAPFFVPLLSWIFLREKIAHKLWYSIVIGFIGILIVLRPGFGEMKLGLIFSLLSGLASASLFIPTRRIAKEPILRILFYYFLISAIVMSFFLFGKWTMPPLFVWGLIALAGVSMGLAQITFTWGLRHATTQEAAPFIYTSIIFSGLIDWLVWKIVPDFISVIGWIVICLGGILTIFFTPKNRAVK